MNTIQLLPLGDISLSLLAELSQGLRAAWPAHCEILPAETNLSYAFNSSRQQYSSTAILAAMSARRSCGAAKVLGITASDLFIPILTFVFGEAQLEGASAVVSTCRLHQEFYGLPGNRALLISRLLKESVHELGHTMGIPHCDDFNCVMAGSHSVEWIDVKGSGFCNRCRGRAKHFSAVGNDHLTGRSLKVGR